MLVYLITLFIVVGSASLARNATEGRIHRLFLFVGFAAMVLTAGLRHRTVGTDSGSYVEFFESITTYQEMIEQGRETWEYGYWALSWMVHSISEEYAALFFVIAAIVVGCYLRAVCENSRNITISLFVLITSGSYTFFFNGARQGIACAICALAIKPLIRRELGKYLGYILLASIFHKTAIVMVPVYFLFRKKNTYKTNILFWTIGIGVALSLQQIVEFGSQFDDRYSSYATAGGGGGYYIVAFSTLLAFFFSLSKNIIYLDRRRYHIFLNMLIFSSVICLISVILRLNPSGILRLNLYFNISVVFLWSILFRNIPRNSTRHIIFGVFAVFYVIFFILITERFSGLTPYRFNESLISF